MVACASNLQEELDTFNIPLVVPTMEPRKTIPSQVLDLCKTWSASHIFANLEYEVDELRRDIKLCELVAEGGNEIEVNLQHDYVVVKPGLVLTGAGKPYSVFSPFHRAWSAIVSGDLEAHKEEFPLPEANDDKARKDKVLKDLFSEKVPKSVPGFEITDGEYRKRVHDLFPAGTEAAEEVTLFQERFRLHDFVELQGSDRIVTLRPNARRRYDASYTRQLVEASLHTPCSTETRLKKTTRTRAWQSTTSRGVRLRWMARPDYPPILQQVSCPYAPACAHYWTRKRMANYR